MNSVEILHKLKSETVAFKQLRVASLKLFGSAARDQAGPDSDADFLVCFDTPPTYDRFTDLKFHLETVLGLQVDLVTEDGLRPEIRQAIEKDVQRVA
jgi:uncharacterized protein